MNTHFTFRTGKVNFHTFSFLIICLLLNFNSFGQGPKTTLIESWNGTKWVNAFNQIESSDGTLSTTQKWDVPSSTWKNASQITRGINPDGTVYQEITATWNTTSLMYDNSFKSVYTYNAAKKVATKTDSFWYASAWQPSMKTISAYDGSNYLISTLTQNWDYISSFKDSSRVVYTNNANGQETYEIAQNWNSGTNTWDGTEQITLTYTSGKLSQSITQDWNSGAWLNTDRNTSTYDGNGYIKNELDEIWDATGAGKWVKDTQENFDNNADGSFHVITQQSYDVPSSTWTNTVRFTYNAVLGIDTFSNQKAAIIFPNPAREFVTIKTELTDPLEYSIIDQLGRPILNGTLESEETIIDINQLNAGLYFIRIGNQNAQSIKLIKD